MAVGLLTSLREKPVPNKHGFYDRRQESCRRRRVLCIRLLRNDDLQGLVACVPEAGRLTLPGPRYYRQTGAESSSSTRKRTSSLSCVGTYGDLNRRL